MEEKMGLMLTGSSESTTGGKESPLVVIGDNGRGKGFELIVKT